MGKKAVGDWRLFGYLQQVKSQSPTLPRWIFLFSTRLEVPINASAGD